MDADKINEKIDNLYDVSEDVAEDYLIDVALMAVLGATTGFFASIAKIFIKKILDVTAFPFLRFLKRKGQKKIDIIEGNLIIREIKEAKDEQNHEAYVIAISNM